jgi:hypothetical protein
MKKWGDGEKGELKVEAWFIATVISDKRKIRYRSSLYSLLRPSLFGINYMKTEQRPNKDRTKSE